MSVDTGSKKMANAMLSENTFKRHIRNPMRIPGQNLLLNCSEGYTEDDFDRLMEKYIESDDSRGTTIHPLHYVTSKSGQRPKNENYMVVLTAPSEP